jgi:hypothetical protein
MRMRGRFSRATSVAGCLVCVTLPAAAQREPADPSPDPARSSLLHGHPRAVPSLMAMPRGTTIRLDGRLDEPAWREAEPATNFTQQRPDDGAPATQRTEVRVLFDDQAIYIGARMYDTEGRDGVRTRLVRRDQWTESDWIELIFDTWHDHVGRTSFGVNPSGVKRDAGVASAWLDQSWDAVWDAATQVDDEGWSAELRIPWSQLRFSGDEDQVWGLQIFRTVSRLNEISMWSYWSQREAGGPSLFGHVEGLRVSGRPRRAEVLPYAVAQADRLKPGPEGDPFYRQSRETGRVGADVKYRLNNSLTLNATVNPDFGQVEVDPAVVNLSAFETFFQERRPFFVEGGGVFGFGAFNCFFCSNTSNLSLFYTRRIGRAPQGALPAGTEYADRPESSSILGAAKVTGRTRSGWTIGLLDAVTARETARTFAGGEFGRQEVEPLTNYFVGRVKRDLLNGNLILGAIGTSVVRDLRDPLLAARLPRHAEAMGLDWTWSWGNRTYQFMGSVAGSNVAGDASAIHRIQRSSARYFQRPDRGHGTNGVFSDAYDPEATRLGGYAAYMRLGKNAGTWLWETAVNLRSPGFEVNDLAFLTRADYVWMNANLFREFTRPTAWYRAATVGGGTQQQYNYDGDRTDLQLHGFARMEFLNYWSVGGLVIRRPEVFDDRALRGGPVVKRPSSTFTSMFASTDRRRAVAFEAQVGTGVSAEGARGWESSAGVTLRPKSNVSLTLGPSFNRFATTQQYVTAVDDAEAALFHGRRYVMADLDQTTLAMNTRLNVTFTPTLTLELFAQPLLSGVDFSRFKEFDAPRGLAKSVYGEDRGSIAPVTDAAGRVTAYDIDPDGPGAAPTFRLANPDFSFRSLRGNAVLRWEYRPGSTVFLVWTQNRSSHEAWEADRGLRSGLDALRQAPADNVLLVKVNYWLSF